MGKLYNVSSSPHDRSSLTTGGVMYNVILALMPATFVGVYNFGLDALYIILTSVITAVLTEFIFDYIVKKPNTLTDGSAVVTGLLLALCLPASVPLYIPFLGSLFAILFVKCFFGGLGKNFMNPALAGRCFLLISFSSIMSDFTLDGVSTATILADASGATMSEILTSLMGFGSGVIGGSVIALILGGLWLWAVGGITWEIPVTIIASFLIFIGLFGGNGFDPQYLLANIAGGGVVMAAIFMATDPVSSPVTSKGQIIYGIFIGCMCGLFRLFSSAADSVSYCVIIGNILVPLIDDYCVPVPYGIKQNREKKAKEEEKK